MSLERGPQPRQTTAPTPEQPDRRVPAVGVAARSLASSAVSRASWACWVRSATTLDELYESATRLCRGLTASTARWAGAGVLRELRSEWYGFAGSDGSCLAFAFDASDSTDLEARRLHFIRGLLRQHECRLSERGEVPNAIAATIRASEVVPVWELPGLAHLAPNAATLEGFPTLAA